MAEKKQPRDTDQFAKMIVELATGEAEELLEKSTKNSAAVELGRIGGKKGGKARAEKITPKTAE